MREQLMLCHAVVCHYVQVLGAKRKTLAGYSSSTVQPHQGFIYGCALIQATPLGTGGHMVLQLGLHQVVNDSSGCYAMQCRLALDLNVVTVHCAALVTVLLCCCVVLCCIGLKAKAARLVGAKCTLLARIDAYGQDPEGQVRVYVCV